MFFFKHRLKMTSLRIGKHRIVKNIASLRKVNSAHPYLRVVGKDMNCSMIQKDAKYQNSCKAKQEGLVKTFIVGNFIIIVSFC